MPFKVDRASAMSDTGGGTQQVAVDLGGQTPEVVLAWVSRADEANLAHATFSEGFAVVGGATACMSWQSRDNQVNPDNGSMGRKDRIVWMLSTSGGEVGSAHIGTCAPDLIDVVWDDPFNRDFRLNLVAMAGLTAAEVVFWTASLGKDSSRLVPVASGGVWDQLVTLSCGHLFDGTFRDSSFPPGIPSVNAGVRVTRGMADNGAGGVVQRSWSFSDEFGLVGDWKCAGRLEGDSIGAFVDPLFTSGDPLPQRFEVGSTQPGSFRVFTRDQPTEGIEFAGLVLEFPPTVPRGAFSHTAPSSTGRVAVNVGAAAKVVLAGTTNQMGQTNYGLNAGTWGLGAWSTADAGESTSSSLVRDGGTGTRSDTRNTTLDAAWEAQLADTSGNGYVAEAPLADPDGWSLDWTQVRSADALVRGLWWADEPDEVAAPTGPRAPDPKGWPGRVGRAWSPRFGRAWSPKIEARAWAARPSRIWTVRRAEGGFTT